MAGAKKKRATVANVKIWQVVPMFEEADVRPISAFVSLKRRIGQFAVPDEDAQRKRVTGHQFFVLQISLGRRGRKWYITLEHSSDQDDVQYHSVHMNLHTSNYPKHSCF